MPFKQRASNMRLQHSEQPGEQPCAGGDCMRHPGVHVQRPEGSSNETLCEGDPCQPRGTAMGKHDCQGRTGEASPAKHDSHSGQQCMLGRHPAGQQAAASSKASGVDVSILEAQSAPPHGLGAPHQAAEAACSPQGAALSEEETVISDVPQRTRRRPRAGAALAPRKRAAARKAPPQAAALAAASPGLTARERSREGRAERAKRRAMLLEGCAARSRQVAERSAADSLPHQGSSGLDGSQGAAWGLATMLQVGLFWPSRQACHEDYGYTTVLTVLPKEPLSCVLLAVQRACVTCQQYEKPADAGMPWTSFLHHFILRQLCSCRKAPVPGVSSAGQPPQAARCPGRSQAPLMTSSMQLRRLQCLSCLSTLRLLTKQRKGKVPLLMDNR